MLPGFRCRPLLIRKPPAAAEGFVKLLRLRGRWEMICGTMPTRQATEDTRIESLRIGPGDPRDVFRRALSIRVR
jgi:hypothetical protein